jgi:hypothetical protein
MESRVIDQAGSTTSRLTTAQPIAAAARRPSELAGEQRDAGHTLAA